MPRQVVPENVNEEMENQVNVTWLMRKDKHLNFEKNIVFPIKFSIKFSFTWIFKL